MNPESVILEGYLKALRLPTFVANYRALAEEAAQAGHSYERFLIALAEQELAQRERNCVARCIQAARFPLHKELAEFEYARLTRPHQQRIWQLAQGAYLQRAEPVILVGNPGLGKTHIAIGLALAVCRQKQRVRFYNAAALVNDLILAQEQQRLPKFIQTALRQQLIVIDELGFIPISATGAHLIFQFVSALYERVALMVTTNLHFADWVQVFGEEQLTAALLDRLTHHAHILEFVGESYRFRQRLQQEAELSDAV